MTIDITEGDDKGDIEWRRGACEDPTPRSIPRPRRDGGTIGLEKVYENSLRPELFS